MFNGLEKVQQKIVFKIKNLNEFYGKKNNVYENCLFSYDKILMNKSKIFILTTSLLKHYVVH